MTGAEAVIEPDSMLDDFWRKTIAFVHIHHRKTEMTENMNPLKLFVYLQWGAPIISTDVANIGYNGPCIQIAKDHELFLTCISNIFFSSFDKTDCLEFVTENNWSVRFKTHIDELLCQNNH